MNFSNLKRASNSLSKITKAIEDANAKKFAADENEWQPTVDKAGNGSAVIRFLPAPPQDGEEALPYVRYFHHSFKGPGGAWLIEKCPTSLNEKCPVCEENNELWNTGEKGNQDIVRTRKRKRIYVTNIYIVTDQEHPENEGKVKRFKFGEKIFNKLEGLMNPPPDEGEPINPFDLWKGANFKLKIKKVGDFRNYDDSKFLTPSALLDGNDELLEKVYNSEHSLTELVAPSTFKSYDDIQKRLQLVLNSKVTKRAEPATKSEPVTKTETAPKKEEVKSQKSSVDVDELLTNDKDSDNDEFFQSLIDE